MDKFAKIKCFVCGIFFAAVVGAESLPIICQECHSTSVPHVREQDYAAEYSRMPVVAVSGVSATASAGFYGSWSHL